MAIWIKHIVGYRNSGPFELSTFLSTYTLETKNQCAYKKKSLVQKECVYIIKLPTIFVVVIPIFSSIFISITAPHFLWL